jgi:predicted outer membrane repeat protein
MRNGDGNGSQPEGGGVMVILYGSPTISDCVFADNAIISNNTPGGGGALACHGSSSVISRCEFTGNSTTGSGGFGGGIVCFGSSLTLTDCNFAENVAQREGGGFLAAPFLEDDRSAGTGALPVALQGPAVNACNFWRNEAGLGGGLSIVGDGTVSDCDFVENAAGSGAGLWTDEASINGCRFRGNTAAHAGGGLYGGSAQECIFSDNVAAYGGGVSSASLTRCIVLGNSAARGGGIASGSSATVQGCTISGNFAVEGSGASIRNSDHPVTLTLEHTIVAFNQGGEAVICGGMATAESTCSDIFGHAGGDWVGCMAGQLGVSGNISEDPLFCNPASGDFTLAEGSPCAPFSPPNPECALIGALPVGCGATAVRTTTWGFIKGAFRHRH